MENYEWWKEVENANKEHNNKARRERIATAALQGMLAKIGASETCSKDVNTIYRRREVALAVEYADALIAELDKEGE